MRRLARSNAGDDSSSCDTAMNEPGAPNAIPPPLPGRGAVAVGSGNDGNPCRRMHRDSASILSLDASVAGCRNGPDPGPPHRFCAARNAGDRGSIPEPALIWMPPPAPGSGKFGMPCERMQSANRTAPGTPAPDPDELVEEPHAASKSAIPARAKQRMRPVLLARA